MLLHDIVNSLNTITKVTITNKDVAVYGTNLKGFDSTILTSTNHIEISKALANKLKMFIGVRGAI